MQGRFDQPLHFITQLRSERMPADSAWNICPLTVPLHTAGRSCSTGTVPVARSAQLPQGYFGSAALMSWERPN